MNHDGSLFVIRDTFARDQLLRGTHAVRLPFGVYYRTAPIMVETIQIGKALEVRRPRAVLARVYGWDCGKDGTPDNAEIQAALLYEDTTTVHATGAKTQVGSYRWRAAFPRDYAVTPDLHLIDESVLHLRALHHLGRCGITSHAHDSDDSMHQCVREQILHHQSGLQSIPGLDPFMELAPTWPGSVFLPGTCSTPIGHAVSYLHMRWWTTNTYATEGLHKVDGDASGCVKDTYDDSGREIMVCCHPPFAALHRIYTARHPNVWNARVLKRRAEEQRSGLPREYVSVSLSYTDAKPSKQDLHNFSGNDAHLFQPTVAHWDATHFLDGNALDTVQIPADHKPSSVHQSVGNEPHSVVTVRMQWPPSPEALLEDWIHRKLGSCTERNHLNCQRHFDEARRCLRATKGWS